MPTSGPIEHLAVHRCVVKFLEDTQRVHFLVANPVLDILPFLRTGQPRLAVSVSEPDSNVKPVETWTAIIPRIATVREYTISNEIVTDISYTFFPYESSCTMPNSAKNSGSPGPYPGIILVVS
jgi:hypothetical protein